MTNANTIDAAQISIRPTSARMTAQSPLRNFGDMVASRGEAVLQGALRGISYIPGGAVLSAAIRGGVAANTGSAAAGTSAEGPAAANGTAANGTTGSEDLLARSQDMSMQYLQLQEQISQENRRYTALSNVLHVRHESAKNAIGNVR